MTGCVLDRNLRTVRTLRHISQQAVGPPGGLVAVHIFQATARLLPLYTLSVPSSGNGC